jgi:hypothetical protein
VGWTQLSLLPWGESISLPAAPLARRSRLQEPAEVPPTSVGSGPSTCGSSVAYDHVGSSLRTSLASELSAQTRCSARWKRRATPAGRSWWVLAMSGPLTDATESGSWGTATCGAHNGVGREGQEKGSRLIDQVLMWPTTTATAYGTANNGCPGDGREEYATRGAPSLARMVTWPTATDAKASGNRNLEGGKAHPGVSLTDAVGGGQQARTSPSTNGSSPAQRLWRRWTQARLNPRWTAELMGYPSDWLDGVRASE